MLSFFMPTKIFFGKDAVYENYSLFDIGKRAFIVCSPSVFKNGSLEDVFSVLKRHKIEYALYSSIKPNPTVEQIDEVVQIAKDFKADFIIGIGGGSPLDSSKAIAVLLANENWHAKDLFEKHIEKSLPLICIPTTCGTGSEVTPYSILTIHDIENKRSFASEHIFPKYAIVDYKYLKSLPFDIIVDTSFDALSHVIEGFLAVKNTPFTSSFAFDALKIYSSIKSNLLNKNLNDKILEMLSLISVYGGIIIAHTSTLVVHPLGYNLTYYHDIPHGRANAYLLSKFLEIEMKYLPDEVETIINLLGFNDINDLDNYIKELLPPANINIETNTLNFYASRAIASKNVNNLRHEISMDELVYIMKSIE